MKKILNDYLFLFVIAIAIVVIDQWSKALVRTRLAFGESWAPWDWMLPYMRVIHTQNTGAAFGMLRGFGEVFTVLAILVSLVIILYFPKVPRQERLLRLAMAMQLGGAVGNLIDRLIQGHVTDFISVGTFPVFNVADASISIGVAVLVISMWVKDRHQQKSGGAPDKDRADVSTGNGIQGD